jgi:hemoglobin
MHQCADPAQRCAFVVRGASAPIPAHKAAQTEKRQALLMLHGKCMFETKPDITGRAEIETLVNTFYDRVRTDEVLGFIFNDVAQTNWTTHLPKMYAFWETVLFRTGGFTGNPIAAHAKLVPQTPMGRAQFDHWLQLFRSTVDDLFAGERAEHIKNCAADMANVIYSRINQVPDPRFDPANLTPEQRARYSRYQQPAS